MPRMGPQALLSVVGYGESRPVTITVRGRGYKPASLSDASTHGTCRCSLMRDLETSSLVKIMGESHVVG